jgi:GT2 family glycosyltransferase
LSPHSERLRAGGGGGPADDGLVSVVLLVHNKVGYSEHCLRGLLATPYRPFEIILADNGSTDSTPALLDDFQERFEQAGIGVTRLCFEENIGAVAGRNQALSRCSGQFIVFVDNDVVPRTRSWMERLKSYLLEHPDVGAVAPKMVYPTTPHLIQCAGCDVSPTGKVWFRGRGEPLDSSEFNSERECQALISACWMMPASAVKVVGVLDEGFSPVQYEDIDYCYRLREAGYKVFYLPAVEMYHFENVTTGRTGGLNYRYLTVKNGLRFKNKWRRRFTRENGPDESSMQWREDIPGAKLEEIGELEVLP